MDSGIYIHEKSIDIKKFHLHSDFPTKTIMIDI